MKEFLVYTGMRLALFLAAFAVVTGIWAAVADQVTVDTIFVAAIVAMLVSGLVAVKLLNPQRVAFARRVEDRAARASKAFEERRAREDAEEPTGEEPTDDRPSA